MEQEELTPVEEQRREYFWMCGPDDLCIVLSTFGGGSGTVLAYIMSRRDLQTNMFSEPIQAVAENTGVSIQTVYSVINKMKFLGLMKKVGKQYMISPSLVRSGAKTREKALLEKYGTV